MRRILTAAVLTVLVALGGCGGGPTTADGADPAVSASVTHGIPAGTVANVIDPDSQVEVRNGPALDAAPVGDPLKGRTGYGEKGTPLTLLVLDRTDAWLYVVLPTRPNGSRGWVPASLFTPASVGDDRITVHLGALRMTVQLDGAEYETPVAVGSPQNPTPVTGDVPAFVTDNLDLPPGGDYGTVALGTSLHSDTITEFAGGDGRVGIHGTSDPASIGHAVTHGCVRVPDDFLGVLAKVRPGTPIVVEP